MAELGHYRVIVIGGGAVGASALYHLTQLGWRDVLLLERDELASGSTWHAAGNVPNFSTSWNVIKFQRYTSKLYARLGAEVDYPINYHVTGSIRLAQKKARMEEYAHVLAMARAQGIDFELIGVNDIKARYPLIELHDILGGLWDPFDGDIDPSQLTQALAKGAKDKGARIERFTPVTAIRQRPSGEWEIETPKGRAIGEIVVNAAGYRAGEVAAMIGCSLPITVMQHQYLVTEAIPEIAALGRKLPLLRDPDISYYLRQERDGLILGPYEWQCKAEWPDGIPADFSFQLYPDDLDRLEPYIEDAYRRVPVLGQAGVQKVINGPIPYSPDGNPYIGPQHGRRNFFNCNTFSFGISQAGGAGKTIAEYIVHGEPEWDLWGFDHRRFTDHADKTYVRDRAIELYQHEYAIGFPVEERPAGRPRKKTPLYDILKRKGAFFGARGGWERACYFPQDAAAAKENPSFHRAEMAWFASVRQEVLAVHRRVGVFDLAGFSKFRVTGPGAAAYLDRLICGALPKIGRSSLAYALTERGGILCEFTVTRLAEQDFRLLSAATALWHDADWLRAHLPKDGSVAIEDLSATGSSLVLAGPLSRQVLGAVTSADLGNAAFPWMSARAIEIAGRPALALRTNYVGELGWEIHADMADLAPIYEALFAAGERHGIVDYGIYAMESMRLEKGYRSWKQDITHEYSPYEANLERFLKIDKGDFIGREALLRRRAAGIKERFVPLLVEAGSADAMTCAIVFSGDRQIGIVGSGGYGHRLDRSIALAYVASDFARPGTPLAIDILGEKRPAVVATEPIFDPTNERLKA